MRAVETGIGQIPTIAMARLLLCSVIWLTPKAPTLRYQQRSSSHHEQFDRSARNMRPIGVLVRSAVEILGKGERTLQDQQRMLAFGEHLRLVAVPGSVIVRQQTMTLGGALRAVLWLWRIVADELTLAVIGRAAQDTGFLTVQNVPELVAVVYIGGSGERRLAALLRLAHPRIALALHVFGQARGIDSGGVHNRAVADFQPGLSKVGLNQYEQPFTQIVRVQQMAEHAHRGLFRFRLPVRVDVHEVANGPRIVQPLLAHGVGQVKPLLQKLDLQHPFDADGSASGTVWLGIQGLAHRCPPPDDPLDPFEKLLAAYLLAILLEALFRKCFLTHRRPPSSSNSIHAIITHVGN